MAGPNDDGPKPAQTGIDGLIVCVRSTYLARLSVCSYTCHSGGMAGLGRAAISATTAQTASEARMRGFFMAVLRRLEFGRMVTNWTLATPESLSANHDRRGSTP